MRMTLDPKELAARYRAARPFPHIVLDGLFEPAFLERALEHFPDPGHSHWSRHDSAVERKLTSRTDKTLPDPMRETLFWFNSSTFIDFLEELTGIRGLVPDPHFEGAGPHCTDYGGRLQLHTDFRFHKRLGLDRRINAILFLNKDWQESHGGHLELWEHKARGGRLEPSACVERIAPVFGRLVVFNTTDFTFHGHPDPFRGEARRSIALYYFTNGRPQEEIWVPPGGQHTLFYARPGSRDADTQKATRFVLRHPRLYGMLRKMRDLVS